MQEQQQELKPDQQYTVTPVIQVIGRAIGIDLNDLGLPGNEPNKHMSIMFRKQKFNDEEFKTINVASNQFLENLQKKELTFNLPSMWGKNSAYIEGEAKDYCLYIREKCSHLFSKEEQRIPHVAIYDRFFIKKIMQEQQQELKPDQLYTVTPVIQVIGRAIGIDLNDLGLPGNEPNKHMTILFRKQKFNDEEFKTFNVASNQFLENLQKKELTFNLPYMWGKNSAYIEGEAKDYCLYIREKCSHLFSKEEQRIPHVAIYESQRKH